MACWPVPGIFKKYVLTRQIVCDRLVFVYFKGRGVPSDRPVVRRIPPLSRNCNGGLRRKPGTLVYTILFFGSRGLDLKEFPMFRFYSFSVFLLCALLICPAGISAQSANDGHSDEEYLDFGEAGGLVVTAGRTPEPAASVPAQVTVITAGDIAESGASNLVEVLERVPGVRFSGAMAGAGSEAVSMRGFGENSHGRVLVLVDGNRINAPDMSGANWNAIPLSDIERVEVMDGSASVQYGNYAVGGVINIITKKSGERRTLIGLSGGSFFSHRQAISHFQPVSWGSFSLYAQNTGTDGYRERQYSRVTNVAAGAEWLLSDNLSLSFNASFADLYFQLPGSLNKEQFKKDPTKALASDGSPNFHDENTERHVSGGVGLQWFPVENIELNLPLSYRVSFRNFDMASSSSYSDRTLHTVEARPQGTLNLMLGGMPLRLLGGLDVYYADLDVDYFADKDRIGSPSHSSTISMWTLGPYVTARFSPLSKLSLSAGLRFDTALLDAKANESNADGNKIFTAFVYEGGIVFNPMQDLKIYARYSSLFRYPFIDELTQYSVWGDSFNKDLKPETGFNTELGGAYRFGNMLDIHANFFFMALKDEIAFVGTSNVNLDRTRRFGTNIGLTVTPLEFLVFDASYSFVNAVFTKGDNKDKYVPMVPSHNIFGSLTVRLPFGLDLGPNFEYTSASYGGGDVSNQNVSNDKLDAFFLLGARARYVLKNEGRELALVINARNLLNKQYATTGYWGNLYPADGISVNIGMQYRF